jgi:beta-N-acetylhexosaminidase
VAGGPPKRERGAMQAGCDMVLLCNQPKALDELLQSLAEVPLASPERLDRMRKQGGRDLRKSVAYREAQETLQSLG